MGACLEPITVVAAVIRIGSDGFLLARRPEESGKSYWEFPGGKVDPGEGKRQALIREIREELGCTIKVERRLQEVELKEAQRLLRITFYLCSVSDGIPLMLYHTALLILRRHHLDTDAPKLLLHKADKIVLMRLNELLTEYPGSHGRSSRKNR